MDIHIESGVQSTAEAVVAYGDTAMAVGSGLAEVYATPAMIALMEKAAYTAVQDRLPEGYSTVGTRIDVNHIAATPVGLKVWAKAILLETEGRKLVFDITAYDEKEKIGQARHERFIIEEKRFMQKAYAKVDNP